tara:strand:- start:985 stop:1596 length:612 start_codon:yes stop_codon:yes gene_type:complete
LPKATLAATIIVAVSGLVDFSILKKTWHFSRNDFYAAFSTIAITLLLGVEIGVASGVILSILLRLSHSSEPHIAEVGLIEGTEHFRNVQRHTVKTFPHLLSLRLDESIIFANSAFLEEKIMSTVQNRPGIQHIIIQCNSISEIDYSALEMLESLNQQLLEKSIKLSLSEVKGPVMDKLKESDFIEHLTGDVYLTHYQAFKTLS